jgi:acetoin utilization protein AcuB
VGTTLPLKAITPDGRSAPVTPVTLSRGARRLVFLPGTRSLVVLRGDISHRNLWAIDIDSGRERQVTDVEAGFFVAAVQLRAMNHIPSIGSVMTPFPSVVQLDDSLLAARALMVEHEVRHLPVQDGSKLVGLLTDRDLKRAMDPDLGLPPKEELFVRDVLVADAYIVDWAEPLDQVLEHMTSQPHGSAAVHQSRKAGGAIFTAMDASRFLYKHLRSRGFPPRRRPTTWPDRATATWPRRGAALGGRIVYLARGPVAELAQDRLERRGKHPSRPCRARITRSHSGSNFFHPAA